MSANLVIDNDEVLYNDFPVKCTESSLAGDDCVFYRDLPTLMNDSEKELLATYKYGKPTLEQACEDFKCGYEKAFDYLYNHYRSKIAYVASKYNDEDLVQELSLVLHNCTQKYEAGGSSCFNTLFWTAARHHVSMIRIRKNSKKRRSEYGEVSLSTTITSDTEDTVENFVKDESVEGSFDNALFYNILNCDILPAVEKEDREIITMIIDEYSIKEISQKLNMNSATIYARLRQLRDKNGVGDILKSLYYRNR